MRGSLTEREVGVSYQVPYCDVYTYLKLNLAALRISLHQASSAAPPLVVLMSLPRSAQVLVVGAGPAGITLALALQQQGCPDVVIVDSVTSGQNTSRAVAVHAATIEVCYCID